MQEKRRYPRENGLVLVSYKIPGQQTEGKSSAFDVSGGGVRIATVDKALEPGTTIEMEIYLPGNSQPILAKGKVTWSQRCKQEGIQAKFKEKYFFAGIRFTIIDERSKNRIINYVQRKLYQAKKNR